MRHYRQNSLLWKTPIEEQEPEYITARCILHCPRDSFAPCQNMRAIASTRPPKAVVYSPCIYPPGSDGALVDLTPLPPP